MRYSAIKIAVTLCAVGIASFSDAAPVRSAQSASGEDFSKDNINHIAFPDTDPTPHASALQGTVADLPPLSASARKKLVARAQAGDLEAMYSLAQHALRKSNGPMGAPMYYWGSWGNVAESERWWRKAAALGDPKAMILLGHMYAEPWGVREDATAAARWYSRVIDLAGVHGTRDKRIAMNNLGVLYEQGRGVSKDESKAADLYGKASGYPSRSATYNLAVLCETGRGVQQDKSAALWLYREAALFDFPEATQALKRLGFIPKSQDDEAGALLAHDKERRAKTACDP